jgi:mitochondrial fission protein ELM1
LQPLRHTVRTRYLTAMAFLVQRIIQSALTLPATIRDAQEFAKPDVVTLPVREGHSPCSKPPVRIFLGTEAAQYKAERVFVWSIEQVRDPSREYEIHLMKHLRGFRSRFWLTGFTNYRFAIPHFAGGTGRAIYNDVDQIYLKDPGELFDLDMGDHGYLAIDPGDISVALFDCEQMLRIWTLIDAQTGRKNPLLGRASSRPGLWGKLDGIWNARDREYVQGASGVLHYTALHRQPWHPFPSAFVYHPNDAADLWFDLEQSANDAGFRVFSASQPSQAFKALGPLLQSPQPDDSWAGDAAVWRNKLEFVPDDDIPWLLDALFSRADGILHCNVDQRAGSQPHVNEEGHRRRNRSIEWWQYQFELVARHHPTVRWQLRVLGNHGAHRKQEQILEGNECSDDSAVVWVFQNRKPGHTSQAIALAQLIGWPYQLIFVPQGLASLLLVVLRLNFGHVDPLRAPWPNVIIACGWWPTRVARWIKKRSGTPIRLLLAGRKCGPIKSPTDTLVSCEHFRLPVHERRIQTILPVHTVDESTLDSVRERGEELVGDSPEPRVALLVGGSSKQHVLSPADATSMGRRVLEQALAAGGSLFAVTSRRTGTAASRALAESLQRAAQIHLWSPDEVDNPYLSYLAAADIIVVSGESESMLMDAIASNKPVYIYPLRQRRFGPWLTLGAKLADWSQRRPKNRRGTERPQQGLEYLCSRILKREWILPPRDLDGLHRRLVAQGYAHMFGESLSLPRVTAEPGFDDLGKQLRSKLAQPLDDRKATSESPFPQDARIQT